MISYGMTTMIKPLLQQRMHWRQHLWFSFLMLICPLAYVLQGLATVEKWQWSVEPHSSQILVFDWESRNAVIELEMLAVCWAVMKCKLFVTGLQHFFVITDHHPLIPIINNHCLDKIENPHLQRFKTRLMAYNLTAEWVKGSMNNAPDACHAIL